MNLHYPSERLYSLPVVVTEGSGVSGLRLCKCCRASDSLVQSPLGKQKQAEYSVPLTGVRGSWSMGIVPRRKKERRPED